MPINTISHFAMPYGLSDKSLMQKAIEMNGGQVPDIVDWYLSRTWSHTVCRQSRTILLRGLDPSWQKFWCEACQQTVPEAEVSCLSMAELLEC